jgi:hypothetical protein
VEHLRDELREVVTSVSSAFRLSDLEPSREVRRAAARTGATAATAAGRTRERAPTRYRPQDVITAEISSLPRRDREAFQTAALRCADGGMTEEITSLGALEQQARQLATLRRADDEPAVASVALQPLDNPTEVEMPSLRALERDTEVELLSLHALDNPTEVEMPSYRALERSAVAHAHPPPPPPGSSRRGATPPPLPKRPSRLPRGSSLVRQRLTPTPTLPRREPVYAARVETAHAGGEPAVRPARETR